MAQETQTDLKLCSLIDSASSEALTPALMLAPMSMYVLNLRCEWYRGVTPKMHMLSLAQVKPNAGKSGAQCDRTRR